MLYGFLKMLDNTFFGTFFAGLVLTWFGISFYRKQKIIDVKYDDERKTRELIQNLFTSIDLAEKSYLAQINIYSGKYPFLKKLNDEANQKFDDFFKKDFNKNNTQSSNKITEAADSLIAHLKMHTNQFDTYIDLLLEKISGFNLFILLNNFENSKPEEVETIKNEFLEISKIIKATLRKLLDISKTL